MARSPKGRPLEMLEGDEEGIRSRGRQIDRLSGFLLDSADVLERLSAEGAQHQDGAAIARIVEAGDEVLGRFRKVGEWYGEVAPHVRRYGRSVRDTQQRMEPVLTELAHHRRELIEARERLQMLEARLADAEARPGADSSADDPAADLRGEVEEWREVVHRLRRIVAELGDEFDQLYDRWDESFDEAADGIAAANRESGMRDRRRGAAVFVSSFIATVPLTAVSLIGAVTCIGRGPRPVGPAAVPRRGWHMSVQSAGFAQALHGIRSGVAEAGSSWSPIR